MGKTISLTSFKRLKYTTAQLLLLLIRVYLNLKASTSESLGAWGDIQPQVLNTIILFLWGRFWLHCKFISSGLSVELYLCNQLRHLEGDNGTLHWKWEWIARPSENQIIVLKQINQGAEAFLCSGVIVTSREKMQKSVKS